MFGMFATIGMFIKSYMGAGLFSILGGIKTYTAAAYLFAKPVFIYISMRATWLLGIATIEWWSGRLYSINCIGEGINGFYNHLFQIASPACTGLLTTHIGLMGVLVASFVITCMWSMYSFVEYIKKSTPANTVLNEYNDVRNMMGVNKKSNERTRSCTPQRNRHNQL